MGFVTGFAYVFVYMLQATLLFLSSVTWSVPGQTPSSTPEALARWMMVGNKVCYTRVIVEVENGLVHALGKFLKG